MPVRKTCKASCSGHASIHFRYEDSRPDEAIRQQLQSNANGRNALLNRSLQPLPAIACAACTAIDCAAEDLSTAQMGADVFHRLVEACDGRVANYPPARSLLNSCAKRLGATCIAGVEAETAKLCRLALRKPSTAPMLLQHWKPPATLAPTTFLAMYADIVENMESTPEVAAALLVAVDVGAWLQARKPRLAERSRLIQLIFGALTKPASLVENGAWLKVARSHLLAVFTYEWPEHYGEILQRALSTSADGPLPSSVWSDLMSALARSPVQPHAFTSVIARQLAAGVVRSLRHEALADTTSMLGRYFAEERLKQGPEVQPGIYVRYKNCLQEMSLLSHIICLSLTSAAAQTFCGALADQIVAMTWPRVLDLYAPWLVPAWPPDGSPKSPKLPWTPENSSSAAVMLSGFVDCIVFIKETLPGELRCCFVKAIYIFFCSVIRQFDNSELRLAILLYKLRAASRTAPCHRSDPLGAADAAVGRPVACSD